MNRLLISAILIPALLPAQAIPPHMSVNPAIVSRSALHLLPVIPAASGMSGWLIFDYSNAIEATTASDDREQLFDAELLTVGLWATKPVSEHWFVFGNVALRGVYDGNFDRFLNWYHELIGLPVPDRNRRPPDRYAWEVEFPGLVYQRDRPGFFVGDLRLGVGTRLGRAQLVGSVTLPTTTAGDEGWGRGTIGTSLALTVPLVERERLRLESGVAMGWTAAHGPLAEWQRTTYAAASLSMWWRFWGRQSLYGSAWFQSPNWQNTGFKTLDLAEISLDAGLLLKLAESWPALQLGLTEDLMPDGPAVDIGVRLGVRWGAGD